MREPCGRGHGHGERIAGDYERDRCDECGQAVRVEVSLGQRFLTPHLRGRRIDDEEKGDA